MAKRNNKSGEITFSEKSRTNSGNTNKESTQSTNNAKLLTAINSLNNTLDKNFKALSNALKDSSKSKGNNKNTEVDKLKLEREKALTAHQLKIQALQEKILKQRIQQANENHERYVNKHYGESIGSVPSKIYSNIKGQGSNAGSALALSLMTGGIINPVIAKEFGLDKIVTASAKFAGRTVSKATGAAWNMTGGLAWNNLKQPFVDPDSRLRQGMSRGANKVSNAFSNPFSLFSNNESDGKQTGAVAKDKDKLSKIEKNTQDMVKLLSKPKDEAQSQEKEKKKSLLDKIFEAIGGMGLILKGAAVAAIPYVIKTFLPKATEWLDEKFKGLLTGKLGLSEGGAEVVSQLVKDALPGALFGLTVGGLKGAIVGGLLSIAAKNLYRLGEKLGEWVADAQNWLANNPISAIGISLFGLANLKNIKNGAVALYKILSGANFSLTNFSSKVISVTKNIAGLGFDKIKTGISSLGSAIKASSLNITSGINTNITSILPKVKSSLLGIGKAAGIVGAAIMAWDIGNWLGEKFGDKIEGKKAKKEHEKVQTKADIVNSMSKEELGKYNQWLHDTGQWSGFAQGYTVEEGLIWDSKNDYDYNKSLEQFRNAQQILPDKYGDTKKADSNAGGYGTLGPQSTGGILHGVKATGLKEMGLKGSVVSSNSIPYIASQNEQALKSLDEILNSWGYEVIYTSAMGGHKPGTGHWKGNKVDLQLKKNGRPTHLSGQQLNMLGQAGYWGRGTGALGWEPVSGQVGGGHYDLYIGGSNSGTALASAANIKLETNDMPTSQESQVFAMNEMNETAQASAENTANSNDSILGMLDSMNTNIASNSYSGLSGMGQSVDISMPSMPSISVSSGGTQGGAGSQTGNVYAFGDVAKTPILYTL